MGLIKAGLGAVGTTLKDQWKDVISCEDMGNNVLMKKITTNTGVITRESLIRVMPGQCAIIMQNGKVLDATAEEGDYVFDESTSPSFFSGSFGEVFQEMWHRFTYGGVPSDNQVVYYFNTKEVIDNKFGTAAPIPYQDWSHPIPNQITGGILPLSVKVKCFGVFTFKISDPSLFMQEIAGTASVFEKENIAEELRNEILSTFQNVLNELGTEKYKIPVLELPSQTDEIKVMMEQKVYDESLRKRGLKIVTFSVISVTLDEKSEEYINNYILGANTNLQQGTLTGAYAEAVKNAANNSNGAVNGFMGVGMVNMAAGGAFGATIQNAANATNPQTSANEPQKQSQEESQISDIEKEKAKIDADRWTCPTCGNANKGVICLKCGKRRPSDI